MQNDSVDKIITRYFAILAKEPFEYKNRIYLPKPLRVSPLLLRGYTCPINCGGCCYNFSLDYLPHENHPDGVSKRYIVFNNKKIVVYSDAQGTNDGKKCKHLQKKDGRCGVYQVRPFSCDFELIRPLQFENQANILTAKLFGRGWSYERVDGQKGALCEMLPVTIESKKDVIRKLSRFNQWAKHFGVITWAPRIIEMIVHNHLTKQVTLEEKDNLCTLS